jgi:hypothetical protein
MALWEAREQKERGPHNNELEKEEEKVLLDMKRKMSLICLLPNFLKAK